MKDRDERSRGIVTHIVDVFTIIKPTGHSRLANTNLKETNLLFILNGNARAKEKTYI